MKACAAYSELASRTLECPFWLGQLAEFIDGFWPRGANSNKARCVNTEMVILLRGFSICSCLRHVTLLLGLRRFALVPRVRVELLAAYSSTCIGWFGHRSRLLERRPPNREIFILITRFNRCDLRYSGCRPCPMKYAGFRRYRLPRRRLGVGAFVGFPLVVVRWLAARYYVNAFALYYSKYDAPVLIERLQP
eukprot:9488212-Pyramimonas_sp.AAC.1